MKTRYERLGQIAAAAGLLGVLLAASGSAMAATYNILLKGTTTPSCATGAFTYTHTPSTPPGSYPVAPSIAVSAGCLTATEPTVARTFNQNSSVQVVLQSSTTPAGDQGSNVVGLTGSLRTSTTGTGVNVVFYTVTFLSGPRLYSVTKTTGTGGNQSTTPVVTNQPYDVRNTLASIPEPETLLLALAGLSALVVSRRMRRRRS
ncbi:MAG: hypothetical protein CVU23_00045 [Betaproteobacteria bacterium HGW-Betaproteobacteria-17]|nr:MAG: hypothetical protein CVU23_00045 [Betaproteobacteria bacterium HGW-Betaproteobacteria-17]